MKSRHGNRQRHKAIDVALGQRLRHLRATHGHTQMTLAVALGLSHQQVQKYETGANRITIGTLVSIAQVLQLAPEDLIAGLTGASGADTPPPAHGGTLRAVTAGAEMLAELDPEARIAITALLRQLTKGK